MDYQNNFKQFLTRNSQSEKENLTQKEMEELEEVINISKESASREEAHRQAADVSKVFYKTATPSTSGIGDDAVREKPFTPKSWSKLPKSPVNVSAVEKELLFSSEEFQITFHDLPEPSGILLDIIYHEPIFERPIPIDCKRYNTQQKAKMLSEHLTKTNQLKARLAKESLRKVPYPKPILPSNKCTTFLSKNSVDEENGNLDDFLEQLPVQDLYLSRAGRQIKRKTYTEETDGDSDPDFTISTKKNKVDDSDLKITLDNPYIPEENHSDAKVESKVTKATKDTPRRGALSLKKTATTRTERLFDKLVQDDFKKKLVDEERENLKKTLPSLYESEEEWLVDAGVEESAAGSDEDFMPRRIVPPIPASKNRLKTRKTTKVEDLDKIEAGPEGPSVSPVLKRGTVSKAVDKPKRKLKTQKSTESPAPKEQLEKTPCPICNREFLQSEIQNHASSCGIDDIDILDEPPESNRNEAKRIQCGLCEKYFAVNTAYEVHVKHCMAKRVVDM